MPIDKLASVYTQELENFLATDFAATGSSLAEKISSIEGSLPTELREALREIVRRSHRTDETQTELMELVFRCGQAFERLQSLRRSRIVDSLTFVTADGSPPDDLEKTDLDAVARFVAARDRFMKAVADFTLKFLLVLSGLLILGVLIGLI